jgi:hypothetical protein
VLRRGHGSSTTPNKHGAGLRRPRRPAAAAERVESALPRQAAAAGMRDRQGEDEPSRSLGSKSVQHATRCITQHVAAYNTCNTLHRTTCCIQLVACCCNTERRAPPR